MTTLPEDFDPFTSTAEDMFDLYREAHSRGCPVTHSTAHGGFDMVLTHDAVKEAATDHETWSSANGVTLPRFPFRNAAIEHDPPEHSYWRGIFSEVLTPSAVRREEDAVRRDAAGILEGLAPLGEADLVPELTKVVPGNTICRLLGITEPERVRLGCRLGVALAEAVYDPRKAETAFGRFAGFIADEIDSRRQDCRDDFLSRMANDEIEGHRLTEDEIHGLCTGFFIAGHETTTSSMSALFHHIATDSGLRDRLVASPKMIGRAAEEAMRLESPLHGFFRTATRDAEIAGTQIAEGSEVWLNFAAANRDPAVFANPETFVADRRPNPHLAFGFGIHTCVGAPLARLELRVVTEELLRVLPDVVATGTPREFHLGGFNLISTPSVPVTFTPHDPTVGPTESVARAIV